jgi:hypothetical protein
MLQAVRCILQPIIIINYGIRRLPLNPPILAPSLTFVPHRPNLPTSTANNTQACPMFAKNYLILPRDHRDGPLLGVDLTICAIHGRPLIALGMSAAKRDHRQWCTRSRLTPAVSEK